MGIDTMPVAQAVEALIYDYGRLVFHVIYGLTGDWHESQDLTQDTFVQALRAIDAARQASGAHFHAKAWLLQIAVNVVRMSRREVPTFLPPKIPAKDRGVSSCSKRSPLSVGR